MSYPHQSSSYDAAAVLAEPRSTIPPTMTQQQLYQQQQQALNPAARPFVSATTVFQPPVAPQVVGDAAAMMNASSNGNGKSSTSPADSTGSGKRINNPYAAVAISTDDSEDEYVERQGSYDSQPGGTVMMNGSFNQSFSNTSLTMSPASPDLPTQNSWSGAGVPSPIAAPLPTSLPHRDNNMGPTRHNGRQFTAYPNHAGPHQHQNNGPMNNNSQHSQPSPAQPQQPVGYDEVIAQAGNFVELARTANGSSFIQSAVKEGSDAASLPFIWGELYPALGDLLLDSHGCYVIKSIMERLPTEQLNNTVAAISADSQLVFSMCTHSLHTRRVVQYLLDTVDCSFIIRMLTDYVAEIAMTQQGCIVMQRAMDVAVEPARSQLFNAIYQYVVRFAMDPFGNYVIQHLLECGDRAVNTERFRGPFMEHCVELSCNKFASNVMEKALFHLNETAQHDILFSIYSSGEETLYRMLQDSFGNYLIQSSIALAPLKDVFMISEKLRPVLQRTPYGHKIEGRLDRRLKGKTVGTRSPAIGSTFKGNMMNGQPPQSSTNNSSSSSTSNSGGHPRGNSGYQGGQNHAGPHQQHHQFRGGRQQGMRQQQRGVYAASSSSSCDNDHCMNEEPW